MIETVLTAIAAFASTNIDDIFILMTLFTQVPAVITKQNIMSGQYMGIITLIVLSLAGSLIGIIVPPEYIGLLGLFPVFLGLKKIYERSQNKTDIEEIIPAINPVEHGFLQTIFGVQAFNIAAITIANGGDNIGIYIPLFATRTWHQLTITISIFLILVYVWVKTARYATNHPMVIRHLKKYNHVIFPLILIALGIYILIDSGTHRLFY